MLNPNSAGFSRNKSGVEDSLRRMTQAVRADEQVDAGENGGDHTRLPLLNYWTSKSEETYSDKQAELSKEFKI